MVSQSVWNKPSLVNVYVRAWLRGWTRWRTRLAALGTLGAALSTLGRLGAFRSTLSTLALRFGTRARRWTAWRWLWMIVVVIIVIIIVIVIVVIVVVSPTTVAYKRRESMRDEQKCQSGPGLTYRCTLRSSIHRHSWTIPWSLLCPFQISRTNYQTHSGCSTFRQAA